MESYYTYYPLLVDRLHYREGQRSEALEADVMVIGYVHSGTGMLFLGERRTGKLLEGSFFVLGPKDGPYSLMADPGGELRLSLIHVAVAFISPTGGDVSPEDGPALMQSGSALRQAPAAMTETYLLQLSAAMKEAGEAGAMRKQLALSELLLHFHAHQPAATEMNTDPLQTTIQYMEQRMAKPIQISELPVLAGMTPSSYCRAFKKLTGLTPGGYLTRLRMLRAKELMANSRAVLRDVALSVGYQDELYFSRVFKKTEGVSPSVYLKRRDRKIAIVSSFTLQDHLLSLGILPIAAPSFPSYYATASGFPSYLHDRLAGTVPLNAEKPIRSSDVVPLGSDLILRTRLRTDLADKHWGENGRAILIDNSTTWEQYYRDIAKWVNRRTEAERMIRHITKLEQEARRRLAPVSTQGTWAIVRLLSGNCRLYGVKDHAFTDLFFNRLQFRPDSRISHGSYENDAFEKLLQLDPEQILIIWSEEPVLDEFSSDSRWQQLKAVRTSRVFVPESREWDPWGPIGREHMIKSMLKYFVKH